MNATSDNKAIVVAGEQLIEALEAFVDDADSIAERDNLKAHIKTMHAALGAFKQQAPQAHSAASGLC